MATKKASSGQHSSASSIRKGNVPGFELFELAHLLRVGGKSSQFGDANSPPNTSGTFIRKAAFVNLKDYNVLVLLISNGTLLLRLHEAGQKPNVKLASWFQSPFKAVKAIALDPTASWLACVCKDTNLYIFPVLSLLQTSTSSLSVKNRSWHTDDISHICSYKQGIPSCALWWQTTEERQLLIIGTESGEVIFIDVQLGQKVKTTDISRDDTISSLELIRDSVHQAAYLLIHTASCKTWRMLLECRPPESNSPTVQFTNSSTAVSLGYDVISTRTHVPIDSLLVSDELKENFLPKALNTSNPNIHHSVQHARNQVLVGIHDRVATTFQVYDVDIELPMFIYRLVPLTEHVVLTDRLLFVINREGQKNILNILSSQMSETPSQGGEQQKSNPSIQKFVLPMHEEVIGLFRHQTNLGTDGEMMEPYLMMDGCVIVTSSAVYECRSRIPPKDLFLNLVVTQNDTEAADRLAITVGLDVNKLYEIAGDQVFMKGELQRATKLYELAKCSYRKRVAKFVEHGTMSEILAYLRKTLVETGAVRPKETNKMLSNLAMQCFVHEVLVGGRDQAAQGRLNEQFNQFINDNFDYDELKALELLADNGLKEQLFTVAKARGLVPEALDILGKKGLFHLPPSVQTMLASRGLTDIVSKAYSGAFIHCMPPDDAVSFLLAKPEAVLYHVKYLESILCCLDETSLLKLSRALDPSRPMSRDLLAKAYGNRRARTISECSVGSLDSSSSSIADDISPHASLDDVVQLFLCSLLILNHNRKLSKFLEIDVMETVTNKVTGHRRRTSVSNERDKVYQQVRLSCGQHHVALVSRTGDLYTWGKSQHGRLGHGDLIEEEGKSVPFRVEILHMHRIKVISVACGTEHTLALCTQGVYAWGSSEYGQIGTGDTTKHTRPVYVTELSEKMCIAIACGHYHSMALSADHRVWTWGWGVHGQLGLGSAEDSCLPSHVKDLDQHDVVQISAGYSHSVVLSSKGSVLTFGGGLYGQLGLGSTSKFNTPQLVTAFEESVQLIACGSFETLFVTDSQKIYTCGRNAQFLRHTYKKSERRGGSSSTTSSKDLAHKLSPTLLDFDLPSNIVQLSCGNWHYVALTETGHVLSWGCNDQGQLGHGNRVELTHPKLVQGIHGSTVCAVGAGSEFTVAVDTSGQVWVWGRADSGQLGLELTSVKPSVAGSGVKKHVLSPEPLTSLPAAARVQFDIVQEVEESKEDKNRMITTWQLPDLLSLGGTQTPYSRESLIAALSVLEGRYDLGCMLRICLDLEEYFMASIIAEIENKWLLVLAYRLQALTEFSKTFKEDSKETLTQKASDVISYVLRHFADDEFMEGSRQILRMIEEIFRFWSQHKLDQESLESILLDHLKLLAYPLMLLLIREPAVSSKSAPSETSDKTWMFNFDNSFHLKVAKHAVQQILQGHERTEIMKDIIRYFGILTSTDPQVAQAEDSSEPLFSSNDYKTDASTEDVEASDKKYWTEIMTNIEKDLLKRPWISLSMTTAATIAAAAVSQPRMRERDSADASNLKSDAIVFTCSHQFVKFYFLEVVLPEFQQRMKLLPVPLPSLVDVLLTQYKKHQSFLSTACPVCVFNALRYEQLQVHAETNSGEVFLAKQWEI